MTIDDPVNPTSNSFGLDTTRHTVSVPRDIVPALRTCIIRALVALALSLGINTCNADLSAEVEETAEEVRIRVHAENNTTADCADGMRVTLDDDLGSRRVLDDRAGAELRVVSRWRTPGRRASATRCGTATSCSP
jgi:hypothetical protein